MSEQSRRVTDWRRERRWAIVKLKDLQQEMEGKLQFYLHLTLMAKFSFLVDLMLSMNHGVTELDTTEQLN